jgi:hypothetical protein
MFELDMSRIRENEKLEMMSESEKSKKSEARAPPQRDLYENE